MEITVFDPDFDVEGVYAADLVSTLVAGLSTVGGRDLRTPPALARPRARPRPRHPHPVQALRPPRRTSASS